MVELNPGTPHIWSVNAVMNGRTRQHSTGWHQGTLSVKSVVTGSCRYRTPRGSYTLYPGDFLLLDHGQEYQMEISGQAITETFCVFLRPGFASEVAQSLVGYDPEPVGQAPRFDLCERLEVNHSGLQKTMSAFYSSFNGVSQDELGRDSAFLEVIREMMGLADGAYRQSVNLDYASAAVRTEVFQRLNLARDFMIENSGQPLNLEKIAGEACLSPNHFHFLFRSAFGLSPHMFLTTVRVARAVRLIKAGDMPLWQVASQVGFSSEAHLCRLVANRTGKKPSQHRMES